MQTLSQVVNALSEEVNQAYAVINSVMPFMQINPILNEQITELERTVAAMSPFVFAANVWAEDALVHEQVLNNVLSVMNDPEFLIYWAFLMWNNAIQHNGEAALQWISDEYVRLLDTYEQKFMAANGGQHSPAWYRRQPQTVNPIMGSPDIQNFIAPQIPMPPVPGTSGGVSNPVDALKQRIALVKNGTPDLAQQLQRAHVQQRQAYAVPSDFY